MAVQSNEVPNWPVGPVVNAESAILMDADTGVILYSKNIHQKEYPSLTIYANGDLAIEETGDVIGNISTSEPAVEYKKYILEKWRTNK